MAKKRVLSVGQCRADHASLSQALAQHYGAQVVAADDEGEALGWLQAEHFDLVLVNRLFDGDGGSGVAFICGLKGMGGTVPVMLVSNYEDAQQEAVAAGALPGFGKAAVGGAAMRAALTPVLGPELKK